MAIDEQHHARSTTSNNPSHTSLDRCPFQVESSDAFTTTGKLSLAICEESSTHTSL